MKPYYERDGIVVIHADALRVLPAMPSKSVDIVVTDPPYNAGKNYGSKTNDRRPWPEWCEWFDGVLAECLRVSRDGVLSFLSQPAYRQYVRLGQHEVVWSLAWIKPLAMAVSAAPFMPHWEHIAYWGAKRHTRGDNSSNGVLWGSDVITANVEYGKHRYGHPTPKPMSLMKQLLVKTTGVILDPFAGSLSTLAAAKELGRSAIGIEIEERFITAGLRRLEHQPLGLVVERTESVVLL